MCAVSLKEDSIRPFHFYAKGIKIGDVGNVVHVTDF